MSLFGFPNNYYCFNQAYIIMWVLNSYLTLAPMELEIQLHCQRVWKFPNNKLRTCGSCDCLISALFSTWGCRPNYSRCFNYNIHKIISKPHTTNRSDDISIALPSIAPSNTFQYELFWRFATYIKFSSKLKILKYQKSPS